MVETVKRAVGARLQSSSSNGPHRAPIRHRVLIVDDFEPSLEMMCFYLQDEPYDILRATDGDEALDVVRREAPDLLLLDVCMPRLDGMSVVRELRRHEATRPLPVVLLTGETSDLDHKIEGLEAGANDFLFKPIQAPELVAKVRTLLRAKQDRDEIARLNQELSRKNEMLEAFNARVRSDLEMARRIQQALLPQRNLAAAGVALASCYLPCDELSGDFFDYFIACDHSLKLVLADVSGHGLPAAMVTSLIKSFCYREMNEAYPPVFLEKLNDLLQHALNEGHFATACVLHYEPISRRLIVCNGGNPPFLIHHRATRMMEVAAFPGPLLGLWPHPRFEAVSKRLQPGDRLLFFTDGLLDLRSPNGDTFGIERLQTALREATDWPLNVCTEHIRETAMRFAQGLSRIDDVAFICIDIL